MTDYVSREAALDRIVGYDFQHCPDYMEDWATDLKHAVICDLKDAVETLPAADVAPVVRCRECIWHNERGNRDGKGYCQRPRLRGTSDRYGYCYGSETPADWYCADGKPKEDD